MRKYSFNQVVCADQSQTVSAGIIACVVGVTIQIAAENAKGFISFELYAFVDGRELQQPTL